MIAKLLNALAKVFTVTNVKGGVGKTTLTVNLAVSLAMLKFKVLILDFDYSNSAKNLLLDPKDINAFVNKPTVEDLFRKSGIDLNTVILPTIYGVDIILSTRALKQLEEDLSPNANMASELLNNFKGYFDVLRNNYDFIVIDTHPGGSLVGVSYLVSTHALVVTQLQSEPIEKVGDTLTDIEEAKSGNPNLQIAGIVPTQARIHTLADKNNLDLLRGLYKSRAPILDVIALNTLHSQAGTLQQPLVTLFPDSDSAKSYKKLAGVLK